MHPFVSPAEPEPAGCTGPFSVLVTRGNGDEIRIGPLTNPAQAAQIQDFIARQTRSTRPDALGCTATVHPYDGMRKHLPPVPTDAVELRALIDDPDEGIGSPFPDIWDRMSAQMPYPEARAAFDRAMALPRPHRKTGAEPAPERKAAGHASIELTLADGTKARWTLQEGDPRLEGVEALLGAPDTLLP